MTIESWGWLLSDSTVMLDCLPAACSAPKPSGMMIAPYTWPRVISVLASSACRRK